MEDILENALGQEIESQIVIQSAQGRTWTRRRHFGPRENEEKLEAEKSAKMGMDMERSRKGVHVSISQSINKQLLSSHHVPDTMLGAVDVKTEVKQFALEDLTGAIEPSPLNLPPSSNRSLSPHT